VPAKNEPKNLVGRVSELAIASAENFGEILLKMKNLPQGHFVASLGRARSDSCIFLTQNISKLFIPQSLTE
jgi:hypothetical protein